VLSRHHRRRHRHRRGRRASGAPIQAPAGLGAAWARAWAIATRALVAVAVAGVASAALAGVAGGAPRARAARELTVKDEGHLHLVRESGSMLLEEGVATGTLPGTVKVRFDVGPTITAQFTIYSRGGGSISGHGSGALHSTSEYSTFGGTLSVTSGTGRFAHARGSGGLYGAIDRKTYALTVQTIGKLSY
jgi:hypothetical protein